MMKAATETGSFVNHVYSRMTKGQPEPKVGMGATILGWTDRCPATIVQVFNHGKYMYIGVKEDNYKRIDTNGMSEMQEYEYTPNDEAWVQYFRFDGTSWKAVVQNKETGRWKMSGSSKGIRIGQRQRYYDFSF